MMAEDAVLGFLEKNEEISDSGKFADEKGLSHDEIVNVIKSLNGFRLVDAQVSHPFFFSFRNGCLLQNMWCSNVI